MGQGGHSVLTFSSRLTSGNGVPVSAPSAAKPACGRRGGAIVNSIQTLLIESNLVHSRDKKNKIKKIEKTVCDVDQKKRKNTSGKS